MKRKKGNEEIDEDEMEDNVDDGSGSVDGTSDIMAKAIRYVLSVWRRDEIRIFDAFRDAVT